MEGGKLITHYYSDALTMYEVFLRGIRESSQFLSLLFTQKNNLSVYVHPVTDKKGHGNNLCEEWGCRLENGNPFELWRSEHWTHVLTAKAMCIINSALLCLRLQIAFGQHCLHVLSVPSDMLPGQPLVCLFFSVFNLYPSSFLLQPRFGMLLITIFQQS